MAATLLAPPTAEAWPELPDRDSYELDDGKWVRLAVGSEAALVAGKIYRAMDAFVVANRLGLALPQEASFQIFPTRPRSYRKPDGAFIAAANLPGGRVPEVHIRVVPSLIIEVVSPFDRAPDLAEKVEQYIEAGVRLVWVVYPRMRAVHIFRDDGSTGIVSGDDLLDGETVIPGFRLALSAIFQAR